MCGLAKSRFGYTSCRDRSRSIAPCWVGVGDPAFSGAYNLLPASFRVVNLSDVVPVVPPSSIFGYQYSHVGQEWSYLFQTGEVGGNHSLLDNYIPAVAPTTGSPVETNAPRSYPNSGIPG